jgi:hypothetical protein
MNENIGKVRKILTEAIFKIPEERKCNCKSALKNALM